MEYPFGHPNHRHHHQYGRDDENPGDYPRPPFPPQPSYGGSYGGTYGGSYGGDYPPPQQNYSPPPPYGGDFPPPPPHVAGVHHISHTPHMNSPNYPPQDYPPQHSFSHQSSYGNEYGTHMESQNYPPPQNHQPSFGHHEAEHESGGDGGSHHFRPHMPGFIAQHFHHSKSDASSHEHGPTEGGGLVGSDLEGYFENKPTFKVYSKAGDNSYSVAIRDGKVVLTYTDPSDPTQHWYKDEKYSTKVKDEDGYPSFSLVNKSTGQAVKHSVSGHPVQLIPYNPDALDTSVLWTESKDLGSGFRTIRTVNNNKLVLDAFNGDKDHGGVHDGTVLALYKCWKGDNQNQQWKLYPHSRE